MGNLEGGSSTRDFERWMKGVPKAERLSQRGLSEEGLEQGAPLLGTLEDM